MTSPAAVQPSRRRIRRYVAWLFAILGTVLVATILVNLWVNPWRVTPTPLSSAALDEYREMSSQIRTGKCGLIRSAPSIGVALVGSSRVANGLDPLDPRWQRDDVYNLGCPAGYFYESEAIFRYMLEYHRPELVIFGLDPSDLSSDFDSREIGDYASSPLGPDNFKLDREIRYVAGISTFEASLDTLRRKFSGKLPQYDTRGLRRRPPPYRFSQLDFLAQAIKGETMFDLPDAGRRSDPLYPEKVALLEGVIRSCREKNIRLILFIHPQHALLHARTDKPPLLPFESERRDITGLVARVNAEAPDAEPVVLWDFGDYHPINCDPLPADKESRMAYWNDFNHYTLEIGGVMLGRMLGWRIETESGDSYGSELRPDNFDAWVERAKDGYRRYVEGPRRVDLEWKQSIVEEARGER